jgi:hypothetical protein
LGWVWFGVCVGKSMLTYINKYKPHHKHRAGDSNEAADLKECEPSAADVHACIHKCVVRPGPVLYGQEPRTDSAIDLTYFSPPKTI